MNSTLSSAVTAPRALDLERAVGFLRTQAASLCRGLRSADDVGEIREVLRAHDASHETWLQLAAAIDHRLGHRASDEFATLYAFHGRVAGSLERGVKNLLAPEIADQVRDDLAAELGELTEATIRSLRAAPAARRLAGTHLA